MQPEERGAWCEGPAVSVCGGWEVPAPWLPGFQTCQVVRVQLMGFGPFRDIPVLRKDTGSMDYT